MISTSRLEQMRANELVIVQSTPASHAMQTMAIEYAEALGELVERRMQGQGYFDAKEVAERALANAVAETGADPGILSIGEAGMTAAHVLDEVDLWGER